MKNLTEILEEAVSQSSITDKQDLLNFVRDKRAEFETAPDVTAVEVILNAAVSANSITQEGKDILLAAVQKSLESDIKLSQSGSQTDAVTSTIDQAEVLELASENDVQLASPPNDENTSGSSTATGNEFVEAKIPDDNIIKAGATPPTDSIDPGPTTGSSSTGAAILNAGSYTASVTGGLLWLIVLYLGAPWLAIGSLSSIQFRDDIEHKYKTTINEILELTDIQADVEQYRSKMMDSVSGWEHNLWKIALDLGTQFDSINSPEGFQKLCGGEKKPDDKKRCDNLRDELTNYLAYQENISHKQEKLTKAIDSYLKKHGDSNKNEDGSDDSEYFPKELKARIGFMLRFHYNDMLIMPEQILTLLLAIAMGVLGSTITMTWTFLSEKTHLSFKWYVLRPFVGALTALVIFIFVKAGQMTLTIDSASSGMNLSPFFLSLLGIAAGLLSDRAYAQMASVSSRILGDLGAEQERWISHPIDNELGEAGLNHETLAEKLNLNKKRISEICSIEEKATLLEQQRISDCLRVHPRILFTDISPPSSAQ